MYDAVVVRMARRVPFGIAAPGSFETKLISSFITLPAAMSEFHVSNSQRQRKKANYLQITGNVGSSSDTSGRREENGKNREEPMLCPFYFTKVRNKIRCKYRRCKKNVITLSPNYNKARSSSFSFITNYIVTKDR
jgi:hypothetical protein